MEQSSEETKYFSKDDFEADWVNIASRNFSQVFKVKVKVWRETFAIKCFPNTSSDTSLYRQMMKEASKMEKMKFSYIVSVYGICNDPMAIVMEYMSNGSMDSLLTSHLLMWPKKFQMIHEVTMGMNFLHSVKPPLLHLNLKPANILLDDHLHVKISDFGLVRWEETSSRTEFIEQAAARGNISYIPPEMFLESAKSPGTKYDVYSFAIVTWEIIAQVKPYPGTNRMAVIMRVASGKRPSLEKIPEDRPDQCNQLIDLMERCWNQDLRQRPCFSEIVTETEELREILKIPDLRRGSDEKSRSSQPVYSKMSTNLKEVEVIDMKPRFKDTDEINSCKDIIGLLSRREFMDFKKMLNKEHVSMVFEDGNSLLHYAVAMGDLETVKLVLHFGATVNSQSIKGYTPLIIAVIYKFLDICSLLLEHGADVNLADKDQWTPLHFAVQSGEDRITRLLLDSYAQVNARERDGWTPLHLASQNGYESMVRTLLTRKVTVDQQENSGRTALHISCAYGHVNIAKLLIGHQADLNERDNGNCTPLHLASDEGHFRVTRLLIKSGADVNIVDQNRSTALHLAALKGHNGSCRQLLAQGAIPDLQTSQGWTPLHLASLKGHPTTVQILVEHHATVNLQGENGQTPLHIACHYGQDDVVSELLRAEADPNIAEDSGWTPLHVACHRGNLSCVQQLISHQVNINAQNNSDRTPLHLAVLSGSTSTVRELLMSGADQTTKDATGCTALQLAIDNLKEDIAELLLRKEN
ncbi:ankyrin repeat and protein kinase domain-containing protein 1 [Lepisosteus oculatus]|uniref:ankyrin repeat and protein kinase domain-containing protein 1 n=1 Tax=Lepisosteus oculatus TaxID=7918 RepID=UPI003718634E